MEHRGIRPSYLAIAMFPVLIWPAAALAQEANPMADQAREMEAMQKKMQDVQGHGPSGAKESGLKRRDLKGQPLSQQGGQEGLTPEQQQMYQQMMQQMEEIKANKAKHDAALDELMKGEGK
jgi:hypothetical protein